MSLGMVIPLHLPSLAYGAAFGVALGTLIVLFTTGIIGRHFR